MLVFNKTKKFIFKIAFLFFIIFIPFSFLWALSSENKKIDFLIAPAVSELQLKRGQVFSGKLIIENKNNFLLPIEIEITNFSSRDEFGNVAFEKKDSSASWLSIEKNFILKPKERKFLNYKIKIPKDVQVGCYYISLIFKPKLPSTYFKENQPVAIPNLTSLFLIGIGGKAKVDFEIVEIKAKENLKDTFLGKTFKSDILSSSPFISFDVILKNNGICHIKPKGFLELKNSRGKSIGKEEFFLKTVLPKSKRILSFNYEPDLYKKAKKYLPDFIAKAISRNIYFGKYKAVLNLHGSFAIEREFSVFIFPWRGILFLVTILVPLLLLIFVFCKINEKREKLKEEGKENKKQGERKNHQKKAKKKFKKKPSKNH